MRLSWTGPVAVGKRFGGAQCSFCHWARAEHWFKPLLYPQGFGVDFGRQTGDWPLSASCEWLGRQMLFHTWGNVYIDKSFQDTTREVNLEPLILLQKFLSASGFPPDNVANGRLVRVLRLELFVKPSRLAEFFQILQDYAANCCLVRTWDHKRSCFSRRSGRAIAHLLLVPPCFGLFFQ